MESIQRIRTIVKARLVAGSVVISLPAIVRDAVGIQPGDRVSIEVSSDGSCNLLEIRKE